jgi:hypothetical protein
MKPLRLTAVAVATMAAACACVAPTTAAPSRCGQTSYSYAGVASVNARFGVGATISALRAPSVENGHVAAWVGVGGYGLGPNGSSEWLQVGISARAGQDPALYYEVARPGQEPRYVMLKGHLKLGQRIDVAVLESKHHPDHWRVWVNGSRMTARIFLPGSHGAWRPIATAESWNGDEAGTCNGFTFKFANATVAAKPGGSWEPMNGRVLADVGYRVERDQNALIAARA